ncbi:MAG TPA: hypothetical protein VLZ81_01310, partial [Blastocatellia bacterium]|nr:hypothetical protein [Blastocatellia bacterium]
MNNLTRDLKHGIRVLSKKPGLAAVAILSLGLGIGANTSIFSLVDSVLLRPLPIDKPDQVVSIYDTNQTGGFSAFSYP